MEIKTGYLYHIKDEFFDLVDDDSLMTNHERGRKRPTYLALKDKEILWFIPLSTKMDKYKKIIRNKIERYGFCNTIMIGEILGKKHAILLQNAFPTLEKYIDHFHLVESGEVGQVIGSLKKEILSNFKYLLKLKDRGINLFFTDVDRIRQLMLDELYQNS